MEEHNHEFFDGIITDDSCPRCNLELQFLDHCHRYPDSYAARDFEQLVKQFRQ